MRCVRSGLRSIRFASAAARSGRATDPGVDGSFTALAAHLEAVRPAGADTDRVSVVLNGRPTVDVRSPGRLSAASCL